MLRILILFAAALSCAALVVSPPSAQAGTWMFHRSYYTGAPPAAQPVAPIDPRVYAGPYFNAPQGDFVRGSWRMSRTTQNVRGRLVDQTYQWESWIQGGAQW